MKPTKKELKKIEQKRRKAVLRGEQMKCAADREYRKTTVENGRKALLADSECNEHSIVLEILVDAISACSTFINDRIFTLGIIDQSTIDYVTELQKITGDRVAEQDALLKDKSGKNVEDFASRTDFIYDSIVLLSNIPEDKRIIALSTLKTLNKTK